MSAVHDFDARNFDFNAYDTAHAHRHRSVGVKASGAQAGADIGFENRSQLAELGTLLFSLSRTGAQHVGSGVSTGAQVVGAGLAATITAFVQLIARRPLESLIISLFAVGASLAANNMVGQTRLHPAPYLLNTETAVAWHVRIGTYTITLPKMAGFDDAERAALNAAEVAIAKTQFVRDIQNQLAQRNLYNGPLNGIFSPKMGKAIRSFELQVGLPETGEMSERLLDVLRSPASEAAPVIMAPRKAVAAGAAATSAAPAAQRAAVPVTAPPPVPVLTVQKRLAELGYGPLRLTGQLDTETRRAIEHYQDDRLLTRTGEINDRFLNDLALVTGKPLN